MWYPSIGLEEWAVSSEYRHMRKWHSGPRLLEFGEPDILGDDDSVKFRKPNLVALDASWGIGEAEVCSSESTGAKVFADDGLML